MEKGQYTEKIYHIASRVPGWIRWAIPGRWMQLHEKHIHMSQHKLLIQFHRKVFCWMDEWIDLCIADIRRMEEETKKVLEGIKTDSEVSAGDDAGSSSAAAPPPARAGDEESDEASK
eukprot:EC793162.1.p1 GENE.EC793162.1~~EC793162.1.p1  ORF type:complete len:117 (+),score=34.91 EC793162.1:250-600(+)